MPPPFATSKNITPPAAMSCATSFWTSSKAVRSVTSRTNFLRNNTTQALSRSPWTLPPQLRNHDESANPDTFVPRAIISPDRLTRKWGLFGPPLLEAMFTGGGTAAARARNAQLQSTFFAFMYMPNGVRLPTWLPKGTGKRYTPSPALKALAPIRRTARVITNLDRPFQSGTGPHAQASSCWLTSEPKATGLDRGFPTGRTLDQHLGDAIGQETPFPTLDLSCNNFADNRETKHYERISWYGPGHAADVERDPRAVYERLFGQAGAAQNRSVIDLVMGEAKRLKQRLGSADRRKLGEFMESARALESQIEKREAVNAQRQGGPSLEKPEGVPHDRRDYIHLMNDLMVLAFETGMTRVSTLLLDPERWNSPRKYDGTFDQVQNHHPLSHGTAAASWDDAMEKVLGIDRFHVSRYVHLVQRLAAKKGPDGQSLLDRSAVVLGSGMGHGHLHGFDNLPLVLSGGAGGKMSQVGQHIQMPKGTPLANLWLTLLQMANPEAVQFADSRGPLTEVLA